MLTKDFWYELPPQAIAQAPANPRDSSKLMALNPGAGSIEHVRFSDIGKYLKSGDLLVANDTKVFKARLKAKKENPSPPPLSSFVELSSTSGDRSRGNLKPSLIKEGLGGFSNFEIFLLRPEQNTWLALAKPGRKLKAGDVLDFKDMKATLIEKLEDGIVRLDFGLPAEKVFEFADKNGQTPTPPYVKEPPQDEKDYQTVYAEKIGSAAAPTAGLHFTPELIADLKNQGINFATVTLHVGLGTFRPMMTETIDDHLMHKEWIEVSQKTCDAIKETKGRGNRVIAVGTTSVRALESAARQNPLCFPLSQGGFQYGEVSLIKKNRRGFELQPFAGFTDLFIKPGDTFHVVDSMITNFHLPESTLLVLVSAFAQSKLPDADKGRQFILKAYTEAIKNGYRFYSFGDAMVIL